MDVVTLLEYLKEGDLDNIFATIEENKDVISDFDKLVVLESNYNFSKEEFGLGRITKEEFNKSRSLTTHALYNYIESKSDNL